MANTHERLHDEMLANLTGRVGTERERLRRILSGEPETERAESRPDIDLAPRIRASRKGTGRLYHVFRSWAEEPPPET